MQLVSKKYKFVIVTVPKNACSTLRSWFHYLEHNKENELVRMKVPPKIDVHKICEKLYTNKPIKDGYQKFAVIRNPWKRVASAYFDKIVGRRWLSLPRIKNITDFINVLRIIDIDQKRCNEHWRSQNTFFKNLAIDKFLKVENLQSDFNTMTEMIGINNIQLPNWKKSAEREVNYNGLYSKREAGIIGHIYSKDVEIGNYTCPDYMVDPRKNFAPPPSRYFRLRVVVYEYYTRLNETLNAFL